MIEYNPPSQIAVNIGDYIPNIGMVLDPSMDIMQELKEAPNFYSMDRGELVANAYVMFAAGTKINAENIKLQNLVRMFHRCAAGILRDLAPSCINMNENGCDMDCSDNGENCCMAKLEQYMHELGIEAN